MKKGILIFLFCFLFLASASASLGISPAKIEVDFEPNKEYILRFQALSDKPEKDIQTYVEGDLSEYVTLSKDTLRGGGSFDVIISLPEEVEKAGKNTLIVGIKELPSESDFIGTTVNIRAIVNVYVPYPGKYLEAQLIVPDGNVNENIPVELHLINRGKESIEAAPIIFFFDSQMDEVSRLTFQPVTLNTAEDRYFRKYLNSSNLNPDNYLAKALITQSDYIFEVNQSFRIGSLFVNVTNFTKELRKKAIQKYFIDVESRWNGHISEVFADVNITNGAENISIRTPSVTLIPWEKKKIEGFLDTSDMEGAYNVTIALSYQGLNSFAYGSLLITALNWLLIGILIGGLVLVVIAVVTYMIIRKKFKKTKK